MAAEGEPSAFPKKVYLVRHAQSLQNVATANFFLGGQVQALGDLIRLGYDAALSDAGRKQLQDASSTLSKAEQGFGEQRGVELVAHSPLQRAAHTAAALFPRFAQHQKMVELPQLHERTITEYFFPALMEARIQHVRRWLEGRPEKVIALVGHGQFFKACMGAAKVQPNVSIAETDYSSATGFTASKIVYGGFPEPEVRREYSQIGDR